MSDAVPTITILLVGELQQKFLLAWCCIIIVIFGVGAVNSVVLGYVATDGVADEDMFPAVTNTGLEPLQPNLKPSAPKMPMKYRNNVTRYWIKGVLVQLQSNTV
jgi:hypothetical protein